MQRTPSIVLILACIVFVLMAGCTSQQAAAPAATMTTTVTPTVTATTAPAAETIIVTVSTTTIPGTPVIAAVTTAPTSDPILHRWIRQYGDPSTGATMGYEFRFFPDGTLAYQDGYTQEISGNIEIKLPPADTASGMWSAIGNNQYLVKYLPTGISGAQIIRTYTLVPSYTNPMYPGVVIPTHIESAYENQSIRAGTITSYDDTSMDYPELAKID